MDYGRSGTLARFMAEPGCPTTRSGCVDPRPLAGRKLVDSGVSSVVP